MDAQGLGRTHPLTPTRRLQQHIHAYKPTSPYGRKNAPQVTMHGSLKPHHLDRGAPSYPRLVNTPADMLTRLLVC